MGKCEIPVLTEIEKKEKELIVIENGTEFHFSYGNLIMALPV